MWRYDPATNEAVEIDCPIDPRAATLKSPDSLVHAIDWDGNLWSFDVKTEGSTKIDHAPISKMTYTSTIAMDRAGRYLYYCAGAHGGARNWDTPVAQCDLKNRRKKVIAFLRPFIEKKYSYTCDGTYSMRLSADDSLLFTTWTGNRTGMKVADFDVCALIVVHIPESGRKA